MRELSENEKSDLSLVVVFLAKQKERPSCKLFPILFDLIGEQAFYDLLRVLAGKRVRFPSASVLVEAHTAISIYKEVSKIRNVDRIGRGKRLDELARIYNCDAKKLYKKAKKLLG